MAAGIFMLPWSDTIPLIAVSGALMTLGYGLGQPSLTALISRASPTDSQGAILGVTHSVQSLVRVLGPITAGALFAAYGRDMPFLVGAAILAVAFAVALTLIRGRFGRGG